MGGRAVIHAGIRLLLQHDPGRTWPLWSPVFMEIKTISLAGGQAGLTLFLGAAPGNINSGVYSCTILGLSGVWHE